MGAPTSIRARVHGLDAGRADALLAAAIVVAGVVPVLFYAAPRQLPAVIAVCVGQGVALAYRRRAPLASWIVAFGALVPMSFIQIKVSDVMVAPFVATIFSSYSLGCHLRQDRAWPLVAAVGAAVVAVQTVQGGGNLVTDLAWGLLAMLAAPMLIGRLVRRRGQINETLRERAIVAERERRTAAAAAVDTERERIAADLHDVVAHALSAMVVQAEVARRDATVAPDRARAAFAAVEGTGREALTEIRRMLGVLRRDDEDIALSPQPTLEHVRSLVERARRAGLAVELVVDGDRRALPAGVDLTGYRVLQTALDGARQTGGAGSARVVLRYEPDAIALEVRDDGAGASRDLAGIHERVSLYGGELRAAPQRGGGHAVLARLPAGATA